MKRKLRVVSFSINKGFCYYYRLNYPLKRLHDLGYIEWTDASTGNVIEMLELAADNDVIIMQGANPPEILVRMQALIHEKKLNKIIISEFDDDMFSIDVVNPAYGKYGIEEVSMEVDGEKKFLYKDGVDGFSIEENTARLEGLSRGIIASDLITTTTDILADRFKLLNENVFVVRNVLDFSNMPNQNATKKKDSPKEVVISWAGGDSHYGDIKRIMPVLKQIQEEYKGIVKFRFFGARFDKLYSQLDHELIPWIKPNLYFDRFSSMLPDIGLIPLEDTEFNRAKSNIKWLEYSYYGIPSVVENVSPYKEDIKDGITALAYKDGKKLYENIKKLIDDPLLRSKIAYNAKKYVMRNYNIENEAIKWYNLFINTLDAKKSILK